jgi:YbbR domain-containing protein
MMNRIQSIFRHNLPAKILALLGAVVLWFFVMNDQNPSVNSTFTVPVYTINGPDGYTVKLNPRDVTVKVKAPRASFTATKPDDFKAYVDLEDAVEGTNKLKVRTVVPQGFEVVDISDEIIEVTMEALVEKQLAVNVQVTGNTGAHSALDKIIPEKDSVKVTGPRTNVERVNRVVGYINLANNTSDFTMKVTLTPIDVDGNIVDSVSLSTQEIDVTAKILSGVDKKVVSIKPAYSGVPAQNFEVSVVSAQPDKVEITGKTEVLEKLSEIFTDTVVVDGANADIIKDVNLVLPDGIISPSQKVKVKIQIKKRNSD